MRHQEFLAGVETRGGFSSTDDARTAADAVLATLADHLSRSDREALAAALPSLLEHESSLDQDHGGDGAAVSDAELVGEVSRRTGWTEERARYALSAVIGQLSAEDPDLGQRIAAVVPSDLAGGDGQALPPDAASEGAQGRPQPEAADELERDLAGLVDWSGDTGGIERTVGLPSEHLDLLLERIHGIERDLGHRIHVVERTPTSLTLRARTESLQAVTTIDVELAARIDDAVADVGSGG